MSPAAPERGTSARLVMLVSVVAMLLGGGAAALAEPDRSRTDDEAHVELRLAILHDLARTDPGAFGHPDASSAPRLAWAEDLARVARDWSDEMAATGDFGHNLQWLAGQSRVAENVFYLGARTDVEGWADDVARRVMQGWMDSDGHRNNLLNDAYREFGIGVSVTTPNGSDGSLAAVHVTAVFRDPGSDELDERPGDRVRGIDDACPQQQVPDSGLTDVALEAQRRAVDCLVWWGVASGTASDTFEPEQVVTRGQLATFVAGVILRAGGDLPAAEPAFSDVDAGSTHADAIGALAAAGLISGYDDGRFGPDDPVQRGQLARFLLGGFEHVGDDALPDPSREWFSDSPDSLHADDIHRAVDAGWVAGYPDGRYRPSEAVRRGHLAVFLARWLDHAVADGLAEPPAAG